MKTMRVPVLVFENKEDVEIVMSAMVNYAEVQNKYEKTKVRERLNEIYKINTIFEQTNNN
jgi:hypothetical protein